METAHNASGGMPARLSHVSAIRRPILNWDTQSDINIDHLQSSVKLTSSRALQAKELVETAYNASGGLPVYLAGHSNGPLYALALLNSTTPQWRQQHVGEHLENRLQMRGCSLR